MIKKLHSLCCRNNRILFLISALLVNQINVGFSQVSTGYNFSSANGNLNFITAPSATQLTSGTTDNAIYTNVPIGFTFRFNGINYTQVGVSNNGFIWFGNTAPAATVVSPISSVVAMDGVISIYGDDLIGKAGSSTLLYQTQGTLPNRTFVVQWNNYVENGHTNARFDLQIVLSECSNKITFYLTGYQYLWGSGYSIYGQVGLRGASNADFFNRSVSCGSNAWTSSTQGGSNTATCQMNGSSGFGGGCWPGYGFGGNGATAYTFTPKVVNSAPTVTCTNPNTACTGNSITIPVASITGGQTPYSIDWTISAGASPAPANGNASNVTAPYNGVSTTFGAAGSSTYNIVVTDAWGCPGVCSGSITVSSCSSTSISTGTITGSPFCAGAAVSISFTTTGTFNPGNIFTAQLSDASGSFASPVPLGQITSTTASPIAGIIPGGTGTGLGYRIRVIGSNPSTTGTDNGVNITINSSVTVSVAISASATTICPGTSVTFSATPTNGGAPTYQWKIGNINAGSGGAVFTTSSLNNNDVVTVMMTSNALCATGSPATSAGITITVSNNVVASVTISASSTSICSGDMVTFSAAPAGGGTTPLYQWKVNNINAGSGGNIFSSSTLNDNDVVTCEMTSNSSCATGSPATSNSISISVSQSVAASVSINASSTSICLGEMVNFTASPSGGGSNPDYQWAVNGIPSGTNSNSFSSSTLNNNDAVTCMMTSSATCVTGSPASSNSISMSVGITASGGTVTVLRDTICSGTPAILSVSGSIGNIQWQSSSVVTGGFSNISGATNSGHVAVPFGDSYYRVYAASGTCSDTSASLRIVVKESPVAAFTSAQTGSKGKEITFNSSSSQGATIYNWAFGDGTTDNVTANPVHIYAKDSLYHVCLTVYNGSNCSFTVCKDVQAGGPGSAISISANTDWRIYPHPFKDYLNISGLNNKAEGIEVLDMLGRIRFQENIKDKQNNLLQINLSELSEGIYFLKISAADADYVQRVIKQ